MVKWAKSYKNCLIVFDGHLCVPIFTQKIKNRLVIGCKKLPWFPLLPQTSSCYRKNIDMACKEQYHNLSDQKGMSDNSNHNQS